ncbi:MAG: hypothetical protein ACI9Y1_003388 [Lentisphaeria bacterium]|jgi:hypothetical protein
MTEVEVIRLKWTQEGEWRLRAPAFGGNYEITRYGRKFGVRWRMGNTVRKLILDNQYFDEMEEAKNRAQLDFEEFISAALIN